MIELIAARGNTSLESAITLTKQIRWDIQSLGVRLAKAAADEEAQRRGSSKAKTVAQNQHELKLIIADMKRLLERIEDAVPLINLAITTSGVNLSTTLPSTVSPSRLLQASTFLTAGDTRYAMAPGQSVQIGPVFTLSMYMLFSAHAYRPHDEDATRETTWKEVIHKARLKLLRVPLDNIYNLPDDGKSQLTSFVDGPQTRVNDNNLEDVPSEGKAYEFAYQLLIIEDLDDDRVHSFDDDEPQPGPLDDVAMAGVREALPIHEISKIFYADTGKILNIGTDGEVNNPVLLLKRDINAVPPRRMMGDQSAEQQWYDDDGDVPEVVPTSTEWSSEDHGTDSLSADDENVELPSSKPWSLPPNLDPEWIALEVYNEPVDSEDEDDIADDSSSAPPSSHVKASRPLRGGSLDPSIAAAFSNLKLDSTSPPSSPQPHPSTQLIMQNPLGAPTNLYPLSTAPTALPALRTSLSLLELLVRLTALQQFQQTSHLAINDELLNFFLSEAGTTGAGGDAETRQRVRREARERVGFDPYDESPIKRRGEEYLEQYAEGSRYEGTEAATADGSGTPLSSRYSPKLADGYRGLPRSPPIRFPLHTAAGLSGSRRGQGQSAGSSPNMSSPLARKSVVRSEQSAKTTVKADSISKNPLVKSESDSTLGTSPGSATAQDQS